MRITYRAVYDIETWELLEWEGDLSYSGPIEYVKGSHSSAEQAAADAQRTQENANAQRQLEMQQRQIDMVNPTLQKIIQAGGMLPEQQSALISQLMNGIAQQQGNVVGQINQSLASRGISGGDMAGSGDIARDFGGLGAAMSGLQQQGSLGIQQMKMSGLEQAMNTALGIGGMYGQNFGSFNQGAGNALNAGVQAGYNADQASTSLLGPLLGGALGMGTAFATGGMSKAGGGGGGGGGGFFPPFASFGCWVAAAIYGDASPEFLAARRFVFERWQGWLADASRWLYLRIGPWLGQKVRKHALLRRALRPLFDIAVRRGR